MFTSVGFAILVFLFAIGLAFLPRATIVSDDGFVDYIVYGPGAYWRHGPWGPGPMDRPWWRRRWCPYRNCPWRRHNYAVGV